MDIEWEIHRLKSVIDDIRKIIDLEIVFNSVNHDVHYHASKTFNCDLTGCAGPSPIWLLRSSLESALDYLNKTFPISPLNER